MPIRTRGGPHCLYTVSMGGRARTARAGRAALAGVGPGGVGGGPGVTVAGGRAAGARTANLRAPLPSGSKEAHKGFLSPRQGSSGPGPGSWGPHPGAVGPTVRLLCKTLRVQDVGGGRQRPPVAMTYGACIGREV